jgi:hypothetical protein
MVKTYKKKPNAVCAPPTNIAQPLTDHVVVPCAAPSSLTDRREGMK